MENKLGVTVKKQNMKNIHIKNSDTSFGLASVLFHWLFAFSIIGLLASGAYMVTLTYYHPWYHPLPHYHKLVGIGVIVLFLARTLWHFLHRQPRMNAKPWEIIAAKATHLGMLLLSGLILFSGYLMISVDNTTIEWLGLDLPTLNLSFQNQADLAGFWHKYLAYILIGMITLHVGATLKHQFIDKHKLLQKILGIHSKNQ